MKVLQEKIEAVTKLSDLERSLTKSEDECGHMKELCERLQEELELLAEKYQEQLKAVQDIQIQLHVCRPICSYTMKALVKIQYLSLGTTILGRDW